MLQKTFLQHKEFETTYKEQSTLLDSIAHDFDVSMMREDDDDENETTTTKRYAMVCAANMNRSMAAHCLLLEKGFISNNVRSFGAGSSVKIPGASKDDPNVYRFGEATYEEILEDLKRQDEKLYAQKGLIGMLERNMRVKRKPERWQDNSDDGEFDVVVCFEERVFDLVLADMREKNAKGVPCLVINVDVRDSHEDAVNAAPIALRLCEMIEKCDDWECEIDEIMDELEEKVGIKPLYSVCYY